MGTCKECKEVFPASEMNNGYCKNCDKPEVVEKNKQMESIVIKNNYRLVTIISTIATILGVLLVLLGIFEIFMGIDSYNKMQKMIFFSGGLFTIMGGFMLVLTGGVSKATTDTANTTKALFELISKKI